MNRHILQAGKYKIISTISHGGFGITYKALRKIDNKIVCIKEFFVDSICTINSETGKVETLTSENKRLFDQYKKRFLKEAAILNEIDCRNIVKVFDSFEENDTAYYVMEYLEGLPLSELIPSGGFEEEEAVRIIRQVLQATKYIHTRNITHLDIKPSNIIMLRNGDIVLIDFGGSKSYNEDGEQTHSSLLANSEGFAPIELYQTESLQKFSPGTDIYEIGATLYNLITGEIPPSASDIMDEGNPIEEKDISPKIKNAIRLAMEPGLKKRLKTTDELISYLDNDFSPTIIDDIDEKTETYESEEDPYIRPGRKIKKIVIATAVTVILLLLVILMVWNHRSQEYSETKETPTAVDVISTNPQLEELKQFVEIENSKQHNIYSGIKIDSLSHSINGLEYHISIGEEGKTIYDQLMKDKSSRKKYVISGLKNDRKLLEICQLLVELDMSLIWRYRYQNSEDIIIELTSDELRTIKGYEGSAKERKLQQFSEMARNVTSQCPQEIEEGIIMVSCQFQNNTIIYNYECNNEMYSVLSENLAEWKLELANQFETEGTMKLFIKECAENQVNIMYKYVNRSTGKTIKITYNSTTKNFS